MLLPEAYESFPGRLPHQHDDQDARYPRAAVDHEPGDQEPEEDAVLERRGVELGRRAPRALARAPDRASAELLFCLQPTEFILDEIATSQRGSTANRKHAEDELTDSPGAAYSPHSYLGPCRVRGDPWHVWGSRAATAQPSCLQPINTRLQSRSQFHTRLQYRSQTTTDQLGRGRHRPQQRQRRRNRQRASHSFPPTVNLGIVEVVAAAPRTRATTSGTR